MASLSNVSAAIIVPAGSSDGPTNWGVLVKDGETTQLLPEAHGR
jgi:hypothetical protein